MPYTFHSLSWRVLTPTLTLAPEMDSFLRPQSHSLWNIKYQTDSKITLPFWIKHLFNMVAK